VTAGDHVSTAVVRVRYGETDQMGVVYYANYLVWFEVGRSEWLRSLGWTYREMEEHGSRLPVVEAHCKYKQSARYDDEIEIRTRGELQSPVRVKFSYDIVRGTDGALVAHGHTVHAATDALGRLARLPERVRSLFA
jgi:acyl-CoA thioester hydrolase